MSHGVFQVMLPDHGFDPAVLVISTVLWVVGAVSSWNHAVFQVVLLETWC